MKIREMHIGMRKQNVIRWESRSRGDDANEPIAGKPGGRSHGSIARLLAGFLSNENEQNDTAIYVGEKK